MSTITKPMALDESFNTTETNPRNIADVLAEMGEAIAQGMGRQANEVSYDNTTSGLQADDVQEAVDELAEEKVDKVTGKGLSTNDYTDAEKTKLAGIEAGAQVNPTIDSELSDSSTNAVQNKVVKGALDGKADNADVAGTQTVSGNPLTLTDAAPINAESLVVELEPKQDLHGYDAPWVGGAGKNKLDYDTYYASYKQSSGVFRLTAGQANNVSIPIPQSLVGKTVTFSIYFDLTKETGPTYVSTIVDVNGTQTGGNRILNGSSGYSSVTFTPQSTSDYVFIDYGSNGGNYFTMSELQLEEGASRTNWAPYSNICPITGYTQTSVEGCGKNLWNGKFVGISLTSESDTFYPNTYAYAGNVAMPIETGETYTFSINGVATTIRYVFLDKDQTYIGSLTNANTTSVAPSNAKYLCWRSGGTLTTGTEKCQIEKGNQATTYVPYASTSATIQFGQTVYGGVSDFVEGGTSDEIAFIKDTHITNISEGVDGNADWLNVVFTTDIGIMKSNTRERQQKLSEKSTSNYSGAWEYVNVNGRVHFYNGNANNILAFYPKSVFPTLSDFLTYYANNKAEFAIPYETASTISTPPTDLKLLQGTNNITTNGTTITLDYQPDNVIGEIKGEIENATPISGTVTATLLHEEDQGEDWIVGFTGEINGHFDPDHFDYYLTARYTHAYNANTQILNMNNCTDGDYVQIWQTGTLDFSVDGGVTVTISVTATKLTFTVNCIGDSIFGIYSSSETTGQVKYLITPARKG